MTESKHQCTCECHVSNNPCCQKCNNPVVQQLVQMLGEDLQGLKIFCVDYGHRLVEIENLFSGKSFKPIHDAMELHVDLFDKRVKSVEHLVKHSQEGIEKCFDRIEQVEKTIHGLIDKIGEMANHYYREKTTPHKCPVCEGKGKDKNKVVAEPYDQQIKIFVNPPCHSCEGKGIVWG